MILTDVLSSENINNNEYLPGRYTDLTWDPLPSLSSKSWIPWLFQRISLVWAWDGYTKHFTSEILPKKSRNSWFGALCASIKWDLCIVRVNVHYYLYFHWFWDKNFCIESIRIFFYMDVIANKRSSRVLLDRVQKNNNYFISLLLWLLLFLFYTML